jgi:hypothetical protein
MEHNEFSCTISHESCQSINMCFLSNSPIVKYFSKENSKCDKSWVHTHRYEVQNKQIIFLFYDLGEFHI